MTFLNPLVLFGLAAAAIPLIIHLFNFRRPRRIDFSSLAFLKELQKSTMQRVRIKQWLLLLLRTLAIAALVLAFARPTLTSGLAGAIGGRANSSIAIIVDNSRSMTLRDAQGAYLDQARDLAGAIVEEIIPGDEVFVLTTAEDRTAVADAHRSRSTALAAIADIEPTLSATTATRAVARAAAALAEATHRNKEVYLLSDLQRSTFVDTVALAAPEELRTMLLPIGTRTHANVAVTAVEVVSRIVEEGQPVRIEATIVNYGTEPIDDYVASVFLEGERVAQGTADLAPGAPTRVTFTVTPQRRGWLAGIVEIEEDTFSSDNERYFTLHVPERRRLLVVRGEGQRTDYVELALSPQLTRGRVAFELETIAESALAAHSLGAYDAVVLVGPRTLSSGEVAALTRYVDQGGGILFFPSAGANAADYNALFQGLGGGQFTGFSGAVGAGRAIASFDRTDLEHPLFEGVFDQPGTPRRVQVESPDVYYAMNYTPGSAQEQTLIQLSNGLPFLQELRHGQGAVLLLTVAADPGWSDLPVRGLFVPLLYRSIYYLASGNAGADAALEVGKPGELRLSGVPENATLTLVSPQGEEFTPERRTLFGAVLLQFDGTIGMPGVYEVQAGGTPLRRVAFNVGVKESNLQAYDAEAARTALAEATGAEVRLFDLGAGGAQGVVQALQAERSGVELWNVFLLLALAFLVTEMLVARQWRPEAVAA